MWIRNTSRYPDAEIRKLVRLATREVDMRKVCVNVRNGGLGGGAYDGVPPISNAPRAARYLVTLRLGRGDERWPLGPINYYFESPGETGPRNRFPFFVCDDWREWLVKLAAHEAQHIEQFRVGRGCSEVRCEQFALDVLEEFRSSRAAPARPSASGGEQLVLPGLESLAVRVGAFWHPPGTQD